MKSPMRAVKNQEACDSILSNRTVIEWKSIGLDGKRRKIVLYGAAHKTWAEWRRKTWMTQ